MDALKLLMLGGILYVVAKGWQGIGGAVEPAIDEAVSWAYEFVHGRVAWTDWTLNDVGIAAFIFKLEQAELIEPGVYGAPPPKYIDAFVQFRTHLFEAVGDRLFDLTPAECETEKIGDFGVQMALDWIRNQYGWPIPEFE